MLRVPYTMAAFVVYENAQAITYRAMNKSTISNTTQTAVNLGSGLLAGIAAALVSQPADTILSKINKTSRLLGEGTASRLLKIAKELGLRGSYSGIGPRLVMVGGMGAGQFAIYGSIKKVGVSSPCLLTFGKLISKALGATGGVECQLGLSLD